jgi:Arc/MetJ-type ribon-helix-helix transcriptional regulator
LDEITAADFVTEKVMKRFPDGALEQVDVLRYGDDPAVEPGTQGIRVIINAGQFPENADAPLPAFHHAHEDALKKLRGDLGLLPPGSWIEFFAAAEDVNRHSKRLRLGPKDSGMGRVPDKERAGETTPVTARLGAAQLETLDTLITAGLAANRAEAVRWTIDRIRDRPAFAHLRERTREIAELAEQL